MFKKINNAFRPDHHGLRGQGGAGGIRSEQDYHSACTVRLVRSTSMLVVGEKTCTASGSTLKRSKSTVSIESTLYYYQRREDRIWLYSQNQNCLEYLEALVTLRRQYTKSVSDLKSNHSATTVSSKKRAAPPPPPKKQPILRAKPSAPPVPSEEATLQFFDAVIAGYDNEPLRKPYLDDGHADVDFIGHRLGQTPPGLTVTASPPLLPPCSSLLNSGLQLGRARPALQLGAAGPSGRRRLRAESGSRPRQ
ncbi:uncharacterized protein C13orf42 isoform 2-T2 [Spinachia spinachia]